MWKHFLLLLFLTATAPTILTPVPVGADTNGTWPSADTTGYELLSNMDLLKDVTFLLVKNLINKDLADYNDLLPTKTYVRTFGNSKIFVMTFVKANNISYQINATVNTASYTPKIIYQHKISAVSSNQVPKVSEQKPITQVKSSNTESSRVYKDKNIQDIIKTPFFITAAVEIAKSINKYQTNQLISIATNEDDPNIIYYQGVYKVEGKKFQVESMVKKKTFIAQLLAQKELLEKVPEPKVQVKPQVKLTQQKQPPKIPIPQQKPSQPKSEAVKLEIPEDNSTKPEQGSNDSISFSSALTLSIAPVIPSLTTSDSILHNNDKAGLKESPAPSNPIPIDHADNKVNSLKQDSYIPPTKIDQIILDQVAGYSQLTPSQVVSELFIKVDSFLRKNNEKVLNKAKLYVAYEKIVALSRFFKVYYKSTDSNTYEAFVAYDQLRDRQHIVSLNPIIYGAK